jgi:hypothetical protein
MTESKAPSSEEKKLDRYPGIRPFAQNEGMLFYGRTYELNELVNSIKAYSLFVLHGKSGLGKTSLLNAGLIPLLRKEGYLPIEILFRLTNISGNTGSDKIETLNPFKAIEKAFNPFIDSSVMEVLPTRYKTLWIYLKLLKEQGKTPVLIFDQFEEFFSYPNKLQKESIIRQMAELLNDKAPDYVYDFLAEQNNAGKAHDEFFLSPSPVHLLYSIRSDKLSLLDEMKPLIPSITNKRFQLNPLFRAQAKQAMLLPAGLLNYGRRSFKRPPFEYEDNALETILKVLSSSKRNTEGEAEIESTQLQIICGFIENKIPPAADNDNIEEIKITEETFKGEEGLRNALKNFYDDQLKLLSKEKNVTLDDIDRVRDMIETKMIYEGMRVGLLEKQVLNFIKDVETISEENARRDKASFIIGKLIDLRLIRPEESYLGTTFVITHDTLIDPITESHNQYIEDKAAKASSIYPDFLKTMWSNAELNPGQQEKVRDLIETRLIVNNERVELKASEIYAHLDTIPEAQVKDLIYDAIAAGLLKIKKTNDLIEYELANDFMLEPVQKEYQIRKAEADYLRVKREKEKLEELQRKNRKLRGWIGIIVAGVIILAYIVQTLVSSDSDRKHAEKLDLVGDKSYTEGNHPLAYALWTKAKQLGGDSTIDHKLSKKIFSPYFGLEIKVSPDQQYVGVLNENRVLTVWKDSDRSDLVVELKGIKTFRFIPNASLLMTQDTAGSLKFLKLLEQGRPIRFSTDSFDLERIIFEAEVNVKVDGSGKFFSVPIDLETVTQRFFWNIEGKYLKNVSRFYHEFEKQKRSRYPFDSPYDRIRASGANSERSLNGDLLVIYDSHPYLLDMTNDSVYTLLNIKKKPENTVTQFLSPAYYAIHVANDGKYVTHVLSMSARQIIFTSAPAVNRPTLLDATRLVTKNDNGLFIQDFVSQSTSFVRIPELNKYRVRSALTNGQLLLENQATDTTSYIIVKDISGKTLLEKTPIISVRIAQKNHVIYTLTDSTLYIYDVTENKSIPVMQKVQRFTVTPDSTGIFVETSDNITIVDLASKNKTMLSREAREIYKFGDKEDRFIISIHGDTLKVYDYKRKNIILNKQMHLSDDWSINIFFPKFIHVKDNLNRQHLLYLDSTQNTPSRLPERFKATIDKKMRELGEIKN